MTAVARRGAYPLPIHQPKQKYCAKKVDIDGHTFDSKMEGEYYRHLCVLRDLGEVRSFVLQPSFTLQPAFKKHGKHFRAIEYRADFGVVYADGRRVVVDVKGMPTPVFLLKKKMYARLFDEPLLCVTKTRNGWREW